MAPRHGKVDIPRGHPGRPELVAPFRQRGAAGDAEEALAVVFAQSWNRRRLEFAKPGTDEVEVEASPVVLHRPGVIEGEVDARSLLARDVDVGRGDETGQPHRSLRIAVDQIAELPRKHALRHDQRGRDVADLVVDLDVEVVDRAAQVFHRRENDTKRGALRLFGVEVGIAALDVVVLARGVGEKGASKLSRAHARSLALRQRGAWRRATARIRGQAEQIQSLRQEELDHVRGAHGLLVAAAEPHRLDGGPLGANAVGVGRLVGAVVGVALAGIHAEQIRPRRAFDDRHFYFAKDFLDGELAGETDGRPALSREVEGRERGVGFEIELLDTTLDA